TQVGEVVVSGDIHLHLAGLGVDDEEVHAVGLVVLCLGVLAVGVHLAVVVGGGVHVVVRGIQGVSGAGVVQVIVHLAQPEAHGHGGQVREHEAAHLAGADQHVDGHLYGELTQGAGGGGGALLQAGDHAVFNGGHGLIGHGPLDVPVGGVGGL